MSTEEQKSLFEESQQQRLRDLGEFVDSLLETAHAEITEKVLLMMISRGLSVSAIVNGLMNITNQRGYKKASGLLDEVSLLLQEDEPR